jgi:uncharacterized protein YjbI with pentapeptide repeats
LWKWNNDLQIIDMNRQKLNRLQKQIVHFIPQNRKYLLYILIIIILVLFILFFTVVEKYFSCMAFYFFGGENSPKGEFLKIILQIIGGLILVIGALATWRQVKIMEKNSVSDKLKIAIEQLGSEKKGIVVGSLHSLHQIAKKDKELIPQILSTFVSHIRDKMDSEKDWNSLSWEEKKKYRIPTEVQTILDILFRNKEKEVYKKMVIDLSNCKLYRANLNYADLQNTYLNKVQLQGAFLSYANLSKVNLEGADLSLAQLIGTILINAKISNSYFIGAELNGAKFQFAKMRDSYFEHAYFSSVHFECAFLLKASFIGCNSIDTNFSCADLSRADFSGSRLIRQTFNFTTLNDTKFYGSFISNSDFKNAILLYTQFNGACSKLSSGRDEISYNFLNTINQRIGMDTEFDKSISFGSLTDKEKQQKIKDFKMKIKDKELIAKYAKCLNNSLFDDTDESEKGLLSKEKTDYIINQFSIAIKYAGIKL